MFNLSIKNIHLCNIWMKWCRFFFATRNQIIQRKTNAVSHKWLFFSSCRLWYNSCLFFEVQLHFIPRLIIVFFLWICLYYDWWWTWWCVWRRLWETFSMYLLHFCDLGVLFLFFFLLRESRKAVNFILRHCTVDQSCKYFTSTKKKQTICFVVSQQIKKSSSLLFQCVCGFLFGIWGGTSQSINTTV